MKSSIAILIIVIITYWLWINHEAHEPVAEAQATVLATQHLVGGAWVDVEEIEGSAND